MVLCIVLLKWGDECQLNLGFYFMKFINFILNYYEFIKELGSFIINFNYFILFIIKYFKLELYNYYLFKEKVIIILNRK